MCTVFEQPVGLSVTHSNLQAAPTTTLTCVLKYYCNSNEVCALFGHTVTSE